MLQDSGYIVFDPVGEGLDVQSRLASRRRQAVFNLGGDRGVDGADQETIRIECLERLGQHLFADAADAADKLAEALRAPEQHHQDERSPA